MADFSKTYNEIVADMSFDDKTFSELYDIFKYQGYNPRDFFMMLWSKAQSNGIDKSAFVADMKAILVFYVTRGTRIDKGKDKSAQEGADRLEELISRYDLSNGFRQSDASGVPTGMTGGTNLPHETVTVARIAGCFPSIVCQLMMRDQARHVVSGPKGMPKGLAWAGAPAVIPLSDSATFNNWLTWATDFDKVIKGAAHDPASVAKYGNIIWKSNFQSNDQRVKTMALLKKVTF